MSTLASPFKRLGGKANLCRWIISNLPYHVAYAEVFGGSAPVLLTKERAKGKDVFNDLDGLWYNSFRVLRDQGDELADLVSATPYSRQEFNNARDVIAAWRKGYCRLEPLELARLHMVVTRQSFSADGHTWSTSSFVGESRARLWARLPGAILRHMRRMQGVYLEQRDYHYILERYDDERTTFYLDPPYFGVEGRYYDVNRKEGFDHLALRDAVEHVKGSVVLSYHAHPEIETLYQGWQIERRGVTVCAGETRRPETELLIIRASDYGRRIRKQLVEFDDEENDVML